MTTTYKASAWKPCDIRGRYGEEVSETLFTKIGAAIASELPRGALVIVGGDFRLSTNSLKTALCEGLLQCGADVADVGNLPSPAVYFAGRQSGADAILIVTASHNPAHDNGLKIMLGQRPPSEDRLGQIRRRAEAGDFRVAPGRLHSQDPRMAYEESLVSRWKSLPPGGLPHLVLDAGNGALSLAAPSIFRKLGLAFDCIACTPDGSFPSRPADCNRTENLRLLSEAVLCRPGSIGIAWDGDGDRVAFVDESGTHVPTDEIAMIFAYEETERFSAAQETAVVDIKFTDAVRRAVENAGGRAVLEKSGHAFMRNRLIDENAMLGLDACGHYFFRELGPGDDGIYSALALLAILQRRGMGLSEMRRTLPAIFASPELRIPARAMTYEAVAARLLSAFAGAPVTSVDGIRLTLDSGVVLARPSSTEPAVSMRIEGVDDAAYRRYVSAVLACLPELRSLLETQITSSSQKGKVCKPSKA